MEPVYPETAPAAGPEYTYNRPVQGHPGAATSTHRYEHVPEEGRYVREHVVNNPRGEMAHARERVRTDEGFQYRRSQTWTGPDGTPIRQHEHTLSGTDPHNYTREHSLTLPDGRTIEHTHVRSWDGAEGTMERSFVGPNGQTQHLQRSWSPDEPAGEPAANMAASREPSGPPPATPPSPSDPPARGGWLRNINPFSRGGQPTGAAAAAAAPRRGFTIGTANAGAAGPSQSNRPAPPAVPASQNAHRPSWAGGAPRSAPQPGPPAHAGGPAAAAQLSPGRGNSR